MSVEWALRRAKQWTAEREAKVAKAKAKEEAKARRREILAMYCAGIKRSDICEKFNLSRQRVYEEVCKARGMPVGYKSRGRHR